MKGSRNGRRCTRLFRRIMPGLGRGGKVETPRRAGGQLHWALLHRGSNGDGLAKGNAVCSDSVTFEIGGYSTGGGEYEAGRVSGTAGREAGAGESGRGDRW